MDIMQLLFFLVSCLLVFQLIHHHSLLRISQHDKTSDVFLHLIISQVLIRQTKMCFQQSKLFNFISHVHKLLKAFQV